MQQQIQRLQLTIAGMGLVVWICAIMAYSWLVRRITRPIGQLVDATVVAAQGDLNQAIQIDTGDEVEVLAENFTTMIREIAAQRQQLEQQLEEITGLQHYLDKLIGTMSDGLMTVDLAYKQSGPSHKVDVEWKKAANYRHKEDAAAYTSQNSHNTHKESYYKEY